MTVRLIGMTGELNELQQNTSHARGDEACVVLQPPISTKRAMHSRQEVLLEQGAVLIRVSVLVRVVAEVTKWSTGVYTAVSTVAIVTEGQKGAATCRGKRNPATLPNLNVKFDNEPSPPSSRT